MVVSWMICMIQWKWIRCALNISVYVVKMFWGRSYILHISIFMVNIFEEKLLPIFVFLWPIWGRSCTWVFCRVFEEGVVFYIFQFLCLMSLKNNISTWIRLWLRVWGRIYTLGGLCLRLYCQRKRVHVYLELVKV